MTKIAITGSIKWEDRTKIKEVLFNLKKRFNSNVEIISCGASGADALVRKCSLEFEMNYKEIPTHDKQWTPYCIEPPFMYNKPYKKNYLFIRNNKLEQESDILILFKLEDDTSACLYDLMQRFNKKNKKILIIN